MKEKELYNSVPQIKQLLEANGLTMQKRFGQNFLINPSAREAIVNALNLSPSFTVWEVGPGIGALTSLLVDRCGKLVAFEIDKGFVQLLKKLYADDLQTEIIEGDVLKHWQPYCVQNGKPDVIVGNLPYNVGSLVIASFIEKKMIPQTMVFTLQKEVAMRMKAKEGDSSYSSFSMLCQLDYHVRTVMELSAGSFYPRPEVSSAVVKMERKGGLGTERMLEGFSLDDLTIRSYYFRAVRDLFKSRRKTIRNNWIKSGLLSDFEREEAESLCRRCGINADQRGEKIPYQAVWRLAGEMGALLSKKKAKLN